MESPTLIKSAIESFVSTRATGLLVCYTSIVWLVRKSGWLCLFVFCFLGSACSDLLVSLGANNSLTLSSYNPSVLVLPLSGWLMPVSLRFLVPYHLPCFLVHVCTLGGT
jgi:hypothetical protein